MKKKESALFIILFAIILNSFIVVSAPPVFTPSTISGISIEPVIIDYLKLNQGYKFHVHVFNYTTGVYITSGATCYLHLYNSSGAHIYEGYSATIENNFDYEFVVNGGNFSNLGVYTVKYQCNNTNQGGANEFSFEVNKLGKELTISEAVLYIMLSIAVLILFALALYINIIIPWGDLKNEIGELLFISNWKYLKVGMVLITYGLFVWLLNILVGISDNFLSLSLYYGFFSFMFNAFMRLSPIIFIIVLVLMAALFIRDKLRKFSISKYGKVYK